MEQHDLLSNDLSINSISQSNLLTASNWGRFLAIVGFIFCALMIFGGIAATAVMSTSSPYNSSFPFLQYIGIIYIILAVVLFLPCLYLLKFSNKMQHAVKSSNQESLDSAFVNLKALFKFYGIMTIVILGIYALAMVFAVGGVFMR
jgi:hypothetical protein